MSDTYTLWCFMQGDNNIFPAVAPLTMTIGELKTMIEKIKKNFLQGLDASSLALWKVRYLS